MSNKIHGYGQPQLPVTRGSPSSTAEVAESQGKPVEPVSRPRDAVSLTETAHLMRKLEEAIEKAPTTDAANVSRVREAIARNEYVVDAQRVAEKMLKVERELHGSKK